MFSAGELRRRVRFDQRALDANGVRLGAWGEVVTRDAKIVPRLGGEGVVQMRLEGTQPVIITVRRDTLTKIIDNSFRGVDARDTAVTWDISEARWNEGDDSMEFLAVQRRGGEDG